MLQMKTGQICQKITHEGVGYGPLMIVDKPTWNNVTCHNIEPYEDDAPITLSRDRVTILPDITLVVSERDFVHIMETDPSVYYHPLSKSWESAVGSNAEIVILKCLGKEHRIYIKNCEFTKVIRRSRTSKVPKPQIRLELGTIILIKI